MNEFDISKYPFELIFCKVNEKRSNIVCRRFFKIKKVDMHRFEQMDFHQAFISCAQMVERALAEASYAFLQSKINVIYVKDISTLSPSQYMRDEVLYAESEECFYECVEGNFVKVKDYGRYCAFIPQKEGWMLDCSLYYYTTRGVHKLLAQVQIDLSKYPRFITTKIDLTGKKEHWKQAKNLVYEIIHTICQSATKVRL